MSDLGGAYADSKGTIKATTVVDSGVSVSSNIEPKPAKKTVTITKYKTVTATVCTTSMTAEATTTMGVTSAYASSTESTPAATGLLATNGAAPKRVSLDVVMVFIGLALAATL